MKGMNIIEKIEQEGTADGKPSGIVKILDCGETSASKIQTAVEKETGNERKFVSMLNSARSLCI